MGLYDTLLAKAKCPHCGFETECEFQTKDLESTSRTTLLSDLSTKEYEMLKEKRALSGADPPKGLGRRHGGEAVAQPEGMELALRLPEDVSDLL